MHYQRSYTFVFAHPQWLLNLLAASACLMIPLVGWVLLLGYLLGIADSLTKQPDHDYPAFDIDRLGQYLARGFRPILLQFVAFLPVFLLAAIAVGGLSIGDDSARGPSNSVRMLVSVVSVAVWLLGLVLSLLAMPATLYLGLGNPDESRSAWTFIQDFLRLVRMEAFLAQVFVLITGLALTVLGLLLCGAGVPSAIAMMGFSQYHLLAQLYQLYLQRGGTALAGRVETTPSSG